MYAHDINTEEGDTRYCTLVVCVERRNDKIVMEIGGKMRSDFDRFPDQIYDITNVVNPHIALGGYKGTFIDKLVETWPGFR